MNESGSTGVGQIPLDPSESCFLRTAGGGQDGDSADTFPDTQLLMQFYAALFRILVVIYGGGLVVALACILWLLRYDEMPLLARPHSRSHG